uniref:Glycosyl hydrolase family 38 C-terminal domain-containing protein n=1 Tax=Lactuca sativa TaxID=4236 RepID=A0A9R1XM28_LACSA|nr:hypothetical protein LSAT_V11C400225760 [Lactuca sativa]
MIAKVAIVVVGGFLGWIYTRIKPPPLRVCGSPGGPPITSPRIQLNDGRHLPYREWGVSKDKANYKIIVISYCPPTETNLSSGKKLVVVVYNSRGWKRSHVIRLPITASVKQSYSFYAGFDGTTGEQASGAYISRPNGTYSIDTQEHITRVFKNKEHAEVEFTVGPIPIDDGVGKEIVTQITTTMKSNKTFYIDSNGRDFLQRIRDYREDWDLEVNQPIVGNYYLVNLGIYLKDETSELLLLVDRSVGGSSIVDGQLELTLHRKLLYDDGKGVAEALNETVCVGNDCRGLTVQGKYYLRIDPIGEGAKWRRSYGQEIYSPLLLAFTEQDKKTRTNFQVSTFSGMDSSYSLPDNVALLTLQELEDGKIILRLAHLYEVVDLSSSSSLYYYYIISFNCVLKHDKIIFDAFKDLRRDCFHSLAEKPQFTLLYFRF